jgi:hypothetical protein
MAYMHTITLKTETETELTFELTFDHAYALTTPYGIDDPSDMLNLFFNDDPSETVTYDLTVFTDPNDYYFATRLTESGYGSDCADYDAIDDLAFTFGQLIDFVTAELTRRNLPLVASRNWPDF